MVVFDRSRHLSSASARQTQIIGTLESTLDAVWLTAPSDRQPAGDGATLFSSGHANCAADAPDRQADADSYWIPREPPGPEPETMKQQF